jgi:hypothetical protein
LIEATEGALPRELLKCSAASKSAVEYMTALADKGLWPPTQFLRKRSIADFFASLADINYVARRRCYAISCFFCSENLPDYRTQLRQKRDALLRQGFGLCLDCVKRGDCVYKEGQCRVEHE